MKKKYLIALFLLGLSFNNYSLANEFGNADFPAEINSLGASSYHDAWCRQLKRNCRVRFQGRKMWVEGFYGIDRSQLISFRFKRDGGHYGQDVHGEKYFYVKYWGRDGKKYNALFLFANNTAAQEFGNALARWYEEDSRPYPNFREPGSQGPQDTHGRDKGMNPYDRPPITDWSEKTTN
jgi:hypothetical protein